MKDDIFDYSDSEELGKPTMNDIRDGKVTLPLIISLQRAPQQEAEHIRTIAEALASHDERINAHKAEEEIKAFVMRYQGIQYANHKMEQLRTQAVALLNIFHDPYPKDGANQPPTPKNALIQLLNYAINRLY